MKRLKIAYGLLHILRIFIASFVILSSYLSLSQHTEIRLSREKEELFSFRRFTSKSRGRMLKIIFDKVSAYCQIFGCNILKANTIKSLASWLPNSCFILFSWKLLQNALLSFIGSRHLVEVLLGGDVLFQWRATFEEPKLCRSLPSILNTWGGGG